MPTHAGLHNASHVPTSNLWSTFASAASDKMPSVRHTLFSAVGVAQVALGFATSPVIRQASGSATCSNPQLSCHNTSAVEDLCCFNSPGGALLQTQFWDTKPVTGPDDSWTIHGLWVRGALLFD